MKDLKNVKTKALKENNFDQIENFIDYETYIDNSYFAMSLKFVQYLVEFIKP